MKKVSALLTAVICLLAAVGCSNSNDNNKTIVTQSFPGCFAHIIDLSQMASATYSDVGYMLTLNYTDLTADVTVSGLRTPDGTSYPTLVMKDIKWRIGDNGKIIVEGSDIAPEISGFANVPLFTSLKIELMSRTINDSYAPGLAVTYSINNRFSVFSSYTPQILFAETVSKASDGSEYKSDKTVYQLEFNVETKRLKITMFGSNFASNMPSFDIVLENIPFNFINNKAIWNADAITPKIGDDPFVAFPITKLSGELDFAGNFTLKFICDPVTVDGQFDVEAKGSYTFIPVGA